jgi:hypothetical protein
VLLFSFFQLPKNDLVCTGSIIGGLPLPSECLYLYSARIASVTLVWIYARDICGCTVC